MNVVFVVDLVFLFLFCWKEFLFMFYKILDCILLSSIEYKVMDIIEEVVGELVRFKDF